MNIFSGEVFFGLILIFGGVTMILNTYWGFDIPFFKTLLAIMLIYAGLMWMFGKPDYKMMVSKQYIYTVKPEDDSNQQ